MRGVPLSTVTLFLLAAMLPANAQNGTCIRSPCIPWPTSASESTIPDQPQFVAGTLGEFRGTLGRPHLHQGVDIRNCAPGATCDRPVFAVQTGRIAFINDKNTNNQSIRIGDFYYDHLSDIDQAIVDNHVQCQQDPTNCMDVAAGTLLGHYSTSFNHVHLQQGGWPAGTPLDNPLYQLLNYDDVQAPTVSNVELRDSSCKTKLQPDGSGGFLLDPANPTICIAATAADAQSLGSSTVGAFSIGFCVLPLAFCTDRIDFAQLLPADDVKLVYDVSQSNSANKQNPVSKFVYLVTDSSQGGLSAQFYGYDTSGLAPGRYTFEVHAQDIKGNKGVFKAFATQPANPTG